MSLQGPVPPTVCSAKHLCKSPNSLPVLSKDLGDNPVQGLAPCWRVCTVLGVTGRAPTCPGDPGRCHHCLPWVSKSCSPRDTVVSPAWGQCALMPWHCSWSCCSLSTSLAVPPSSWVSPPCPHPCSPSSSHLPPRGEGCLPSAAGIDRAPQGGGCRGCPARAHSLSHPQACSPLPPGTSPIADPLLCLPQVGAGGDPARSPHLPWGPLLAGGHWEAEQPGQGVEQDPGHGGDAAPGQAGGRPVRLLGAGGGGGTPRTPLPP